MKCPKCKLISPDDAQRCDCGYDFQSKTMKTPYCKAKPWPQPFPSFIHFILAYLAGCFGCGSIAFLPHFWLSGTSFFAVAYLIWFGIDIMDPTPVQIPLLGLAPMPLIFLAVYGSIKHSRTAFAVFLVFLLLNIGGCRGWPTRLEQHLKDKSKKWEVLTFRNHSEPIFAGHLSLTRQNPENTVRTRKKLEIIKSCVILGFKGVDTCQN